MTNDILQIPQIPSVAPEHLQNDYHIGFTGDIATRLQAARWTDETRSAKAFPEHVDAAMAEFIAAQAEEDAAYVVMQGSILTRQRRQQAERRDMLLSSVKRVVGAFASLTVFPERQRWAATIRSSMLRYSLNPDSGIEAQTVATAQWLADLMADGRSVEAARALGIYDTLVELQQVNAQVQQLTADRNDERSAKQPAGLLRARRATDRAFRALALMLNAGAVMAWPDNARYTELIRSVEETVKYYRQLSADRRRTSRRVLVKSPVVGNRSYAAVGGWTWRRLIQDSKAALAVDTDASPQRIVSTDKKALKAGGLVLALAGAAVAPTDEVDSAREYELIAVG